MCEELEKSARRVVGMKQVLRALESGKAVRVYLAGDARESMRETVLSAAEEKHVPVVQVATMRALSKACRVDVPSCTAALIQDTANY